MKIEGFEPIFGEPKAEWADSRSDSLGRFLFHVSAPDSSHLLLQVTDFRSNTWEAKRSVLQLDDMVIFFSVFLYIGSVLYFVVSEIHMNWFIEVKKNVKTRMKDSSIVPGSALIIFKTTILFSQQSAFALSAFGKCNLR